MADEYFYGVTLSSTKKVEEWDPEAISEKNPKSNKLTLSLALLGPDAKTDEINVVQVETMSMTKALKIPLAVLKAGESRYMRLNVEFPDAPVTFTLLEGSGPVHLIGKHELGAYAYGMGEEMEEMEEEMMEEEDGEEFNKEEEEENGEPKSKKAKATNNSKGKNATPKKNATKK